MGEPGVQKRPFLRQAKGLSGREAQSTIDVVSQQTAPGHRDENLICKYGDAINLVVNPQRETSVS
jgi:hypothetical protein